jgi:hypothetical protein
MRPTPRTVTRLAAALAVALGTPLSAQAITYYDLTKPDSSTAANPQNLPPATNVTNPVGIFYGGNGVENQGIFSNPTNSDIVGTGVIRPFIRIQPPTSANCNQGPCQESGYNTDGRVTDKANSFGGSSGGNVNTPQYDGKDLEGSNWNRTLDLNTIPIVEINGVKYREFILDINERNNSGDEADRFLSLDKFKLYLSSDSTLDNFYPGNVSDFLSGGAAAQPHPDTFNFFANATDAQNNQNPLATKIYDIDTGGAGGAGDSSILLDYALNSGSGNGIDMVARIPDSFFSAVTGTDPDKHFLYLYSSFGEVGANEHPGSNGKCSNKANTCETTIPVGDFGQSAGFEEWSSKYQPAPEPGSLALLALGAGLLALFRRRAALNIA